MPPEETYDFPRIFDSTMIASAKSCRRLFFLSHIRKLRAKIPSVHLNAGGAFAAGIEGARRAFYIEGFPPEEAVLQGGGALLRSFAFDPAEDINAPKGFLNVMDAFFGYFSQWPLDHDHVTPYLVGGVPAIEFTFAYPLPIKHPVTDEPILYCGRFDMLGVLNGMPVILDEKTTGYLGASWSRSFDLRGQYIGYTWGAHQAGVPVVGAVTRGIGLKKTGNEFVEAINYYPKWVVEEWFNSMLDTISSLITYWQRNYFPKSYATSCESYGGCIMSPLCTRQDPEPLIAEYFEHNDWSPIRKLPTQE
jgi:hypothetical protein